MLKTYAIYVSSSRLCIAEDRRQTDSFAPIDVEYRILHKKIDDEHLPPHMDVKSNKKQNSEEIEGKQIIRSLH